MRIPLLAAALALSFTLPAGPVLAANLPPGHPPLDKLKTPSPATHVGTVIKAIPAAGYVYVHAKTKAGDEWLAGPATDLKPGAKIRWNDGMIMRHFSSPTLKRTFDAIRFVEILQPAD